jgi:beta-glucosidase
VTGRPGAEGGGPAFPGTEGIEFAPITGPVTDMGWPIESSGLTALLTRIATDYPGTPLMITENGAAFPDQVEPDGERVADNDRIAYLDGHLRAAHQAIENGVDLRGYLVWSLLDNFEWAEGYNKRFGVIHVDYLTQRRIIKDSARWYQSVIRQNGLTT